MSGGRITRCPTSRSQRAVGIGGVGDTSTTAARRLPAARDHAGARRGPVCSAARGRGRRADPAQGDHVAPGDSAPRRRAGTDSDQPRQRRRQATPARDQTASASRATHRRADACWHVDARRDDHLAARLRRHAPRRGDGRALGGPRPGHLACARRQDREGPSHRPAGSPCTGSGGMASHPRTTIWLGADLPTRQRQRVAAARLAELAPSDLPAGCECSRRAPAICALTVSAARSSLCCCGRGARSPTSPSKPDTRVATLAKHYAGVLRELEGQPRKPAADVIREAREQVRCSPYVRQATVRRIARLLHDHEKARSRGLFDRWAILGSNQ